MHLTVFTIIKPYVFKHIPPRDFKVFYLLSRNLCYTDRDGRQENS